MEEFIEKNENNERENENIECPRCGFEMVKIQSCHYLCLNCGGQLDCSDI